MDRHSPPPIPPSATDYLQRASRSPYSRKQRSDESSGPVEEQFQFYEEHDRYGGPLIPGSPVVLYPIGKRDPWAHNEELMDELQLICMAALDKNGVVFSAIDVVRLGTPEDEIGHKAFIITAERHENEVEDSWFRTLDTILRIFRERGLGDVVVELRDSRRENYQMHSIKGTSDIVSWYQNIMLPSLLRVLGPPNQTHPWLAIDLVRYGDAPVAEDNPITAMITIRPDVPSSVYRQVRQDVVAVVSNQTAYPDLHVVIQRGWIELFRILGPEHYAHKVEMGASIALQSEKKSGGSLGGYVTLRHRTSGKCRVFGLTCWHVVDPDLTLTQQQAYTVAGVAPGTLSEEVVQPALVDHQDTMVELEGLLLMTQEEIATTKNKKADVILTASKNAQELEIRQRRKLYEQSAGFGKVWAASGHRTNDKGFCLDWGLIDVNGDRRGRNLLPDMHGFPRGRYEHWFPHHPEEPRVAGLGDLRATKGVFKVGRTTGRTAGEFHAIYSLATLAHRHRTSPSKVYLLLGMEYHAFAQPGDSGAFVLDHRGNWVGLIVAGCPGKSQVYAISATDVVADIEKITGWEFVGVDCD